MYTCMCAQHTHIHVHMQMHTNIHVITDAQTHTHTHTHTHICMQTHIHTHIHPHTHPHMQASTHRHACTQRLFKGWFVFCWCCCHYEYEWVCVWVRLKSILSHNASNAFACQTMLACTHTTNTQPTVSPHDTQGHDIWQLRCVTGLRRISHVGSAGTP